MNLTAINDIAQYTVNESLINNTAEIGANLVTNANVQTQGYLGLGIMICVFIVLMIILMAEQEVFRFGFLQSLIASSGFVSIIGIVLLAGDIVTSYQHVLWFGIIFAFALLGRLYSTR